MEQLYGITSQFSKIRSSDPEVFQGKGVLKICSKSTGENPRRSAISIKLLCNFIEITLQHGCSPVNLLYICRTTFTKNTSGWLLLLEMLQLAVSSQSGDYQKVLQRCSAKKLFLKNSQNLQKHLYQSLFFNSRPATLLKKKLGHRCFPVNFAKFLRTHFFNITPLVAASGFSSLFIKNCSKRR